MRTLQPTTHAKRKAKSKKRSRAAPWSAEAAARRHE